MGRTSTPITRRLRTRRTDAPGSDARPTVTVVIPCFNYGRFLPAAVESALTQEDVDIDVVVVDDCSTDDSLAVARALAARAPAVTVLAHERNQGPVATFNDGLDRVTGEYLVRLDADDMLTPGSLARATALARAFPSVGLVYGHPRHFAGEPPAPRSRVRSWTVWPGRQWLADRCRSGLNVITSPEVVMRTSVAREVGGQQPLAYAHDMEMWLRVAAFSDIGRVDGPDQAWHREHATSLTEREGVDPVADIYERRAVFDTLFAGRAGTIPESAPLRLLARDALAREALRSACHLYDRGRATDEAVARLTALARELAPAVVDLPEWRQLQRRIRLGADRVRRDPRYTVAALRRRLRYEVSRRRWARTGVWERSRGLPQRG